MNNEYADVGGVMFNFTENTLDRIKYFMELYQVKVALVYTIDSDYEFTFTGKVVRYCKMSNKSIEVVNDGIC